jgi:hypothetical protein
VEQVNRRDAAKVAAAVGLAVLGASVGAAQEPYAPKKVVFTKDEMDTYEKVAKVIGSVMDGAYKDIIRKLASGDAKGVKVAGFESGVGVTNDELAIFFSLVAGSSAALSFAPKVVRPVLGQHYETTAIPVDTTKLKDARLVSGSVTCGVSIVF